MKLTVLPLLLAATQVLAISKISRQGRYLYQDDGSRFFLKGIAYQTQGIVIPGPNNPLNQPSTFVDQLADSAGCTRDLPFLQKLGVNAIRAYSVDSSLNHDACMSALSGAGIYVILDLTLPLNGSIDTTVPAWGVNILDQYINTINVFSKYDNVLAYNIGNEVLTNGATNAAPFLKAAARDIKAYLTSISSTALVGYADIDGAAAFRDAVANYLSCDPSNSGSGASAIDIFGLNNYEWCGDDIATRYDTINQEFADYNVVAYFSEFGSENCSPGVRPWTEVGTLFASPMTDVWSGGLAFSYFPAESTGHQFGMATLSSDNTTVTTNADFDNLVTEYGKVSFVTTPAKASAPASTFPACPAEDANLQASTTLPATPNAAACQCLSAKLGCSFKVPTNGDFNALVGTLTDTVCGLLPGVNGSCADIGANGTAGVYGGVSGCDPITKLSYAFSQYYDLNARQASACDFQGNATINASATDSPASALTQCNTSPSAVFTPSAPAGGPTASGGSGSGSNSAGGAGASGSGSGNGSGAVSLVGGHALVGVLAAVGCVMGGMMWTLA
ncbi:glycoside hydrolase family 72 protein [Mycena capillaripes]|nr:glycoside hydrolase family 72 protein [Mycena capillaripes]